MSIPSFLWTFLFSFLKSKSLQPLHWVSNSIPACTTTYQVTLLTMITGLAGLN
jgi:hypothetical protein